jgi:CRP-like cAMP-binding protein
MNDIKNYFDRIHIIPYSEWLFLEPKLIHIECQKNTVLQGSNEAHSLTLVYEGLLYVSYDLSSGRKRITNFICPTDFFLQTHLISGNTDVHYYVESILRTQLITINSQTVDYLLERHSCWQIFFRKLIAKRLSKLEKYDYYLSEKTSHERYIEFCKD